MRVMLTSPWIPAEWVRAHGMEARGVWFETQTRQTLPLAAGICAFAENVGQMATTPTGTAIIFSTACDQLRRAADAVPSRGAAHSFLFNLPATTLETGKRIYQAELERLGRFLVALGGTEPSPETLREEMRRTNEARRQLAEVATAIGGRAFAELAGQFHCGRQGVKPLPYAPNGRVPLAIVGGPLLRQDWPVLDAIEALGGCVVLNGTDMGERGIGPVLEMGGDPIASLVEGYYGGVVDVFQRPNVRLYDWLSPRLKSRHVRGIVLWGYTGCDLWRAELQTLRETFQLPVLLLESGEGAGITPRDGNRLQAFVETLT